MTRWFIAALLVASTTVIAQAQENLPPETNTSGRQASSTSRPQTPLKVLFVLSRLQGEKKISSLPYTLGVLSNGRQTNMRMGINVPVIATVWGSTNKGDTAATIPQTSFNYRDVGTNIDCTATDSGSGVYALTITVEDSSIQPDGGDKNAKIVRDVPIFRRFNASFSMLLRDGQTMQYVSVTDPLSGEVMKIDVTLSIAK